MSVALQPAQSLPADVLHTAFLQAFADYLIGPFDLPLDRWPLFLGRQCADLSLSRVAMVDGSVAAFAFVAARADGTRWRLATMGALPAARGGGAAQALLDDMVWRAAAAGVRALELEAFAQNERALRLYRSRGFVVRHELHAYERTALPAALPEATLQGEEVGMAAALAWLEEAVARVGDVPMQVTPASLTALPDELRAWRSGTAQMILGWNAQGSLVIHSLLDQDPVQRHAEALVLDLQVLFPGRRVVVPPLQRLDLGGRALARAGFDVQPMHQVMMLRSGEP